MSTISETELSIQNGLEALQNLPFNDQISLALRYISPKGYRPIVQLEEEGRKKRSTASADSWNPATGEIVIYFEPFSDRPRSSPSLLEGMSRVASETSLEHLRNNTTFPSAGVDKAQMDGPTEVQITQCCQALADAEKAGKHFIALKWFRDDFLTVREWAWVKTPQDRQLVLTQAIESGKILTKKRPNPKAPDYPTTTISLNRENTPPGLIPRFRPIPVRGEEASATLLRDRGSY